MRIILANVPYAAWSCPTSGQSVIHFSNFELRSLRPGVDTVSGEKPADQRQRTVRFEVVGSFFNIKDGEVFVGRNFCFKSSSVPSMRASKRSTRSNSQCQREIWMAARANDRVCEDGFIEMNQCAYDAIGWTFVKQPANSHLVAFDLWLGKCRFVLCAG